MYIGKNRVPAHMNNKANLPLLYSVLNPETSSDSPSAKSKGVRFVSARVVVNQHRKSRGNNVRVQGLGYLGMWDIVSVVKITIGLKRIRDILTS